MAHIDYYFGTPSPWSYLAGNRLEEIAARHGATIRYKPVDLLQLFDRTGGVRPANRHPSRMEYRAQELRRWSQHLGMALNPKPAFWPVNPAPSSYAIIAAQEAGGGDLAGLVQGFMRAVWAEERDISDDAVIREILGANGTNPEMRTRTARKLPPTERRALEILEAKETWTRAEIRKQYKSLVKDLHPDMNGGDRSDEDRLQEVVWAWDQIKDSRSFKD